MLKRGAMEHRPTPTAPRKREPLPGSDGLTPNGAAEISHATNDPDAPSDPVILPTFRPPWKADNDRIHSEDMPERFTEHLLDGVHGQTIDTSGFTSPANVFPRFPYLSLFYRLTLCSLKGGHPAAALRRSELSRLCSLFRGPLRSSTITVPSTLLRVHLPPLFRSFSRPRGGSTCAFRSYRKRWLLLFRDKASWRVLPPLCRIRCGQLFQFGNPRTGPRDLTATRVFESQPSFDTSSAVHFRSTPSRTPEAFSASFPSPFNTKTLRFQHRRAV